MFLCPTSCLCLTRNIAYYPGWRTSQILHKSEPQWKRISEKERWEDETENCVHRCSSFNFMSSPPQCRSLARLSDVIISFWWRITQTVPANANILSPVSTEDREQTLKLSGQNPICASAVCIPSLLVPTLQWSRRSGRIGSSRNHNGHHPDSSHSTCRRWTARCTPCSAVPMPLKRETFFYCRWQNTYFVPPLSSRWNKGILKSQREE